MQQAVLHNYPSAIVKYKFACRKGRAAPIKSVSIIDSWWNEVKDEIKKTITIVKNMYLSQTKYENN